MHILAFTKKHLNFTLYMYKGRYTYEVIYQFVS